MGHALCCTRRGANNVDVGMVTPPIIQKPCPTRSRSGSVNVESLLIRRKISGCSDGTLL